MAILTTTNQGLNFIGGTTFIQTGTTTLMAIATNGNIAFNQYGAGTLVTDASGNITAVSGGGAGGPYLPLAGGTMTLATSPLILPGEESNQFKIAFTGASASSGLSTVDQSGAGLYIGANSRVNNSGVVVFHDTLLPSSGIYFDGWNGDDMEFYTGSSGNPTKRLTIGAGGDAIFTGNVGIGTTSPSGVLNVNKENGTSTVTISRGGTDTPAGTTLGNIVFTGDYSASPTTFASIDAYPGLAPSRGSLDFKVKSTSGTLLTGMTVYGTSAGVNVGIGITNPSSKLELWEVSGAAPTMLTLHGYAVDTVADDTMGAFIDFKRTDANASFTPQARIGMLIRDSNGDNGIISEGCGNLVFHTSRGTNSTGSGEDVERMRITDIGNVGIGTTTPNAKLDIQGTQGQLFSVTDDLSGSIFAVADISGVPIFDVNSSGVSYFDGNVGIGTTSPGTKLSIRATTASHQLFSINRANSNTAALYIGNDTGNDAVIAVNNGELRIGKDVSGTFSEYVRIDDSGNVGIGETSPGEKLEVAGNMFLSNDNSKIAINLNLGGTPTFGYTDGNNGPGQLVVAGYASSSQFPGVMTLMNRDGSISANQDLGVIQFVGKDDATNGYASSQIIGTSAGTPGSGSSGGGILRFLTTPNSTGGAMAERMRIDNLGKVTIGKTTAALGALDVAGTLVMSVSTTARFKTFYTSGYTFINGGVSGNDIYFGSPSTYTQNIKIQGTATATNFILSSDKTLKDNIEEIDTKHIDVSWKNFELKSEPGVKRSGVIAQELEKTNPEFVRTDKEGLKSVAYIDLLITKIAELEARLEKAGI